MKVVLVLAILVIASLAAYTETEYQSAFTFWMQKYQKTYHHDEFIVRYRIFRQNMNFIQTHNNANKGFTVALNEYADLSSTEFAQIYLGTKFTATKNVTSIISPIVNAPVSWDWRTKGVVTKVKNQQQCGSCWAFSTTGSTEGCHALVTKNLVSVSEQNLVDCSTSQGNQGCDGGLMTQAMDYIIQNKGIDTEASYPYTAEDGTCAYSPSHIGATLKSYTNVITGNEADLLLKAVSGPVSVAIDASQSSFQFYSSGVYYEPACSSTQLDHGVLVVGWGVSSGTDYWLVKNSWGSDWGLSGYIMMSRLKSNNCGIATMATLPHC